MTGQWRPLPDSLPAEVAYLVSLLRDFKDRSGLSLAALAEHTNISKSSWDRYLNGRTLPPRHAVQALAQLVGEPTRRPLALWERARTAWSGRDTEPGTAESGDVGPVPSVVARRRVRPWHWAVGAAGLCVVVVAFLVLAHPMGIGTSTAPTTAPYTVGCRGAPCDGLDPTANDCGVDAVTFADLRVGRLYLELRISDQCQAGWARISQSMVGDEVLVLDRSGRTQTATVPDQAATGQYVYTPMVAAARHSQVRACLQPRTGVRRCTGWGADLPVPVVPPGVPS
jgi:hypothetical protein